MRMSDSQETLPQQTLSFESFGLSKPIMKALDSIGYETPSPIQEQCIAHLMNGRDIIGQAQTGTGKTAAFALPLLNMINIKDNFPQLLILAPTRELAIQVAEAVQSYAHFIKGFHVLPIYGGQSYDIQLRPLRRGVHVVVGTPGRVMDHIKKGTLKLDGLRALVLDEADEMLRMGFIDDVKWVLSKTPEARQIALFSATMPDIIRKIAKQFLKDPAIVKIKSKTTTATTIRQRYWLVSGAKKLDALTRILEVEPFEGLIIFVRTKTATVELADRLSARGFSADCINGDIAQNTRERTIEKLKKGQLDILVATDVAARGLDVERISHVINYDIPHDPESYVHRIGRTGRAGRSGDAILFVAPRERRMLSSIERVSGSPIEPMKLPTADVINEGRINSFKQKITETLSNRKLDTFVDLISQYQQENDADLLQVAAALAQLAQGKEPLLVSEKSFKEPKRTDRDRFERDDRSDRNDRGRKDRDRPKRSQADRSNKELVLEASALKHHPEVEMIRYKLSVGYDDDVKPGNIMGAIANEAEIESQYIGVIDIYDEFSTIDLPAGMPKETFDVLKNTRVCGRKINIAPLSQSQQAEAKKKPSNKEGFKKADAKKGYAKNSEAKKSRPNEDGKKPLTITKGKEGSFSKRKPKAKREKITNFDSPAKRKPKKK